MGLEPIDQHRGVRLDSARDVEGAVVHVAACPAGDLGELAGGQLAKHLAVPLARAGEGHVIDIEVEPHADGVGGDEEIDIAGSVERYLGVACAGLSAPRTTAAPPRWRRISSAMA